MFTFFQYLLPKHLLSRLAGLLANCQWQWFKNLLILNFVRHFKVDLSEAVIEDPTAYKNFNDFFTRSLKKELRPIEAQPNTLCSPVDGCASELGTIATTTLIQAKGFYYDLITLVGNCDTAKLFLDGQFATFYLAPRDYHKVHMPFDGKLIKSLYIPGSLFSVNKTTTQTVPQLFTRNERLISLFETEFGPLAVILVGATLVGSINTVWSNGNRSSKLTQTSDLDIHLRKGEELGYFKMGSTVILLTPKDKLTWSQTLRADSKVKMGELIATLS